MDFPEVFSLLSVDFVHMIIKKHDHSMVGDGRRPFQLQSVTQVTDKFLRTLSLIGSAEDRGVLVATLSVTRL